jgi:hypothetical protein
VSRNNPCKGREAGCTANPKPGESRCKVCRAAHNAREAARRAARRAECKCWVCGAEARLVGGVYQATCEVHQHYRREVSASQ